MSGETNRDSGIGEGAAGVTIIFFFGTLLLLAPLKLDATVFLSLSRRFFFGGLSDKSGEGFCCCWIGHHPIRTRDITSSNG